MLNVARVVDGIVVNTEIADAEWIANDPGPGMLIEVQPFNPAHIGLGYDPETGFEQPPAPVFHDKPGPGEKWALGLENDPNADYDDIAAAVEAALNGQ